MKMRLGVLAFLVFFSLAFGTSSPIFLSGTVKKNGGGPLKGVVVSLKGMTNAYDTTDAEGKFLLQSLVIINRNSPQTAPIEFKVRGSEVFIPDFLIDKALGQVEVFSTNGRKSVSIDIGNVGPGVYSITLPPFGQGLSMIRFIVNGKVFSGTLLRLGNTLYLINSDRIKRNGNFSIVKTASGGAVDTLIARKTGYLEKRVPITKYVDSNLTVLMDSAGGAGECKIQTLPEFAALPNITEFPDPFKMMDGTRMTKKSQWLCRRQEIRALAEKFMFGPMPPKPDKIEPSYSGGTLTIKVTVGSKTSNISVKISGNTGSGPYPAIMVVAAAVYGVPSGIATINFNEQQFAKSDVNGRDPVSGIFYDLYPSYKTTGALMAWAWGAGRIIDALEMEEIKAQTKIDPTRIGVTGCSYAGKAALAIGAFEERIALTLPIESGAGGFVAWRFAEANKPPSGSQNGCQYASEAYGEANWMGDAFQQFGNAVNKLPIDMHEVAALCAPRGLLATQALTQWLCPKGGWLAGCATHIVYDALGYPDNMGYLVAETDRHCQKGNTALNEQSVYNAFVNKFLKGDNTAKTSPDVALRNNQGYPSTDSKYIPWTKPNLSDD